MKTIAKNILSIFRKERQPAERGHLIALSGAVLIGTDDGNNVVVTPKTAREIADLLPDFAKQAERESIRLSN